jgi:tetratricopeptide (TPR) repeat protein
MVFTLLLSLFIPDLYNSKKDYWFPPTKEELETNRYNVCLDRLLAKGETKRQSINDSCTQEAVNYASLYLRSGEKIKKLVKNDNFKEVSSILNKKINNKNNTNKLNDYFNLGLSLQLQRKHLEAITAYKKAIKIKPDLHQAYYNMGIAYRQLGGKDNLNKAITAYQKAIQIKPDKDEAYYNMGIAYDDLGGKDNLNKAIKAYQKVIKIKPDDDGAYYNMGNAYRQLGGKDNLNKAITAYQKAIQIKPDLHQAYNNMGSAYYQLGGSDNLKETIKAYQKATQIKPDKDGAYINLFELQLTQNKEFDPELVAKFKQNCASDTRAMMQFEMLSLFKAINSKNQVLSVKQQQMFKAKYQGENFGDWSWAEIENWIKTKKEKTHLLKALEFFKT